MNGDAVLPLSGLRVGFAGTPVFAAVALEALCQAGAVVPVVLTQPDRPAGRGMQLQASAVKQTAIEKGLQVAQPLSLKLDGRHPEDARQAQAVLEQADLDVMVVAAYGLILPPWVLALPRWGCVNIHGSLLPRWRGAAPIHRAIEAGDRFTGITIMQMDEGLDTGDIISMQPLEIGPHETTGALHDRLSALGAEMVVKALTAMRQGTATRTPQPNEGATYAKKIEKTEAQLDWQRPAEALARCVRAFNPQPGASVTLEGQALKVWAAQAGPVEGPDLGEVGRRVATDPARGVAVRCGHGWLWLQEVQRPGGKRLPALTVLPP